MDPNTRTEQSTAAGVVPPLESVHAIVLYDPEDGRVRHIHHVFVLRGGSAFDREAGEKEALAQAEAMGHRLSSLRVLYVPNLRDARATYRVDLETKALVRVQRSTLVKRSGRLD